MVMVGERSAGVIQRFGLPGTVRERRERSAGVIQRFGLPGTAIAGEVCRAFRNPVVRTAMLNFCDGGRGKRLHALEVDD